MRLKRGNVERIAATKEQAELLKKDGFKEVIDVKSENKEKETAKSLDEMNVGELRSLAAEKGIEGTSGLKKEELLAILKDVV